MSRRFCLDCGAEYAYEMDACSTCGAPAHGGAFDENLVRALAHAVPDVAANAARILGVRKPDMALEPLLSASRCGEPERAEAALEALCAYSDVRVDERLREARELGSARERAIARDALRRRKPGPTA
jgi:hypothetical protein